ncbi:hypothetical protein C0416_01835 [bacterium]|nr:hypothetical protein [bacterium]
MNIDSSISKEGNEITNDIFDAKNKIANYLTLRIAELTNSIEGETPDEENNYSKNYYSTKDYRDQLNRFLEIVESAFKEAQNFDSVEDFLQSISQKIQNFPKESYDQIIKFIEETFDVKVKPLAGPPMYYTSWLNYYSKKYKVTPEKVQEVLPYELFQKFEQSNDTAARIRLMMDNFGEAE